MRRPHRHETSARLGVSTTGVDTALTLHAAPYQRTEGGHTLVVRLAPAPHHRSKGIVLVWGVAMPPVLHVPDPVATREMSLLARLTSPASRAPAARRLAIVLRKVR